MKTLTVHQPWAWAIVHSKKKTENRSRATKFRGPLLIHAAMSRDTLSYFNDKDPEDWLFPDGSPIPPKKALTLGAIIGSVELVDVREDDPDDPWGRGPVCWILDRAVAFPTPVPCSGQLGLWNCPDDILKQILPMLKPA